MPPHATHLLQLLDVVLFQPYKHWHAKAVDDATRTGCIDLNKVEFLSALDTMQQKTFKRTSILSGFRCTRLIPYNPEVVLSKMRENQPFRPLTPDVPSSSADWPNIFNTPLTIRTL